MANSFTTPKLRASGRGLLLAALVLSGLAPAQGAESPAGRAGRGFNYQRDDLPEGPWLFPEDQLSDLSQRAMAAELTREQLFRQLHQELPYSLTVETEGWAEAADGSEVRIDQTIYVQRESQKAIVLGRGGQQIKAVGEGARRELEAMLGRRVHLFLFVKVRRRWLEDPERYQELGLEFPG